MKKQYDLNEVLKAKAAQAKATDNQNENKEIALDDISRVKILSPGRKVFKRFIRNRLAVVGSIILITMFAFAFLGPLVYPYGQKEVFHKYGSLNMKYAQAKENTAFTGYPVADTEPSLSVRTMMNSLIKTMRADGVSSAPYIDPDSGDLYRVEKSGEEVYRLYAADAKKVVDTAGVDKITVGDYLLKKVRLNENGVKYLIGEDGSEKDDLEARLTEAVEKAIAANETEVTLDGTTFQLSKSGKNYSIIAELDQISYTRGVSPMGEAFEEALKDALASDNAFGTFSFENVEYRLVKLSNGTSCEVYAVSGETLSMLYTRYTFDHYDANVTLSEDERVAALLTVGTDETGFTAGDRSYTVANDGEFVVVKDAEGREIGEFTVFSIRRYSGQDTIEYALKKEISAKIDEMNDSDSREMQFVYPIAAQDEVTGEIQLDENGDVIKSDAELTITRTDTGVYNVNCDQITYLIDKFASPTAAHILGTDGDGFDVFARIMYGGRVSLMVGFVVVIIETILGVIMGGLAGFYGKWVDMIIMRLVDIFYCIPSLPILIILGVLMDFMRKDAYFRLVVLMATLGILGWASVARLVRGQILSLREQEFMVAAEATGLKVRTRIFKHLIPNVMPQLIVTATMGMGGVILTESTLSFLGLGVKHPLATWGTMINSVSSQTAIAEYPHIWIPVGLLICLTVVAFNFVGDGLRDAYDPRSKK